MYAINNAKTGIFEFDAEIEQYISYLASIDILPNGRYCLAGGAIRSIFDKTKAKDLDIYILGTTSDHQDLLTSFPAYNTIELDNPFTAFKVVNINKNSTLNPGTTSDFLDGCILNERSQQQILTHGTDIQVISMQFDPNFSAKSPFEVSHTARYASQHVSSIDEVLSSFDLTICKAGVEFVILDGTIAVSEVRLPATFLTHIALRKLAFSHESMVIPQQLCSIKRFYKYLSYGYMPDETFFMTWHERVKNNPHILSMSYNDDI